MLLFFLNSSNELHSHHRRHPNLINKFNASNGHSCLALHLHSIHPSMKVHYLFVAIVYIFKSKVKVERMYDHGRRLVLYGIAGIFEVIQLS